MTDRTAIASVTLLAILCYASCGPAPEPKDDGPPTDAPASLLQQAEKLNAMSRYDEAIALLAEYLAENPRARLVNFNLGAIHGNKGDHATAAKYFLRELELDPSDPTAYHHLGLTAENQGALEEAVRWYQGQSEHDEGDWFPRYRSGYLLRQLGRQEEAIEPLEQATRLNPDEPDALVELGKAVVEIDQLERGRELFSRAIEARPDHPEAHYNLGRLLIRLGDKERGNELLARFRELAQHQDKADHYQQTSGLAGSNHVQRFQFGNELIALGRFEEALEAYRSAILMSPSHWQSYLQSGVALMELGRHDDALEALQAADRLRGGEFTIKLRLAHVHALLDRREAARGFLQEAAAIRALNTAETLLTSEVLFRAGFATDGWLVLQDAARRDPRDHAVRFAMAMSLHRVGKIGEALDFYRQVIGLEPGQPAYHVAGAMAELEDGRTETIRSGLGRFTAAELRESYGRLKHLPGADGLVDVVDALAGAPKS